MMQTAVDAFHKFMREAPTEPERANRMEFTEAILRLANVDRVTDMTPHVAATAMDLLRFATPAQEPVPNQFSVPGYASLSIVLEAAYNQSARGKGKERHANEKPFTEQPIMAIARMVGLGYQTGQIMKKVQEATTMASRGKFDAARAEMLGAIVYAAAAHILIDELQMKAEGESQ